MRAPGRRAGLHRNFGPDMERYFFELRLAGRRLKDDDGHEFSNLAQALKYGRLVARELLQGREASAMVKACVVVLDQQGQELGTIHLVDVSEANSWQAERRYLN